MAEHSIAQAMRIEQCAKFANVCRQMFWGNGCVFDERNRSPRAFESSKQADAFLAQRPQRLDVLLCAGNCEPSCLTGHPLLPSQLSGELLNPVLNRSRRIRLELDQIDRLDGWFSRGLDQMAHAVPDSILARQGYDTIVNRFYRPRVELHQRGRGG